MTSALLAAIVGIIFIVLGLAIIVRYKKLTKRRYFQILIIIIALLLIGFGIYFGWRGIELYG